MSKHIGARDGRQQLNDFLNYYSSVIGMTVSGITKESADFNSGSTVLQFGVGQDLLGREGMVDRVSYSIKPEVNQLK